MAFFAGGKFTGSHTTVIDPAVDLLKALNKCDQVNKIVLGVIRSKAGKGGGQIRYKTKPINNGIELTVSGPASVQNFYIYTSNASGIKKLIAKSSRN